VNTNPSIDQLKRKAYLAYHQDGIVDILLGSTILGIGLWILLDSILFNFMAWMSFILYAGLKNTITIPRFGYVRFDETETKFTRAIGVGIALMLLMLVAGLLFFIGPDQIPVSVTVFLRKYFSYLLSGLGALAIGLIGMVSGIRRLIGYAVLMIVTLGLSMQIQLSGAIPLLFSGSLILLIGSVYLFKFIHRYPLQSSEAEDVA